jgi:hypothetical protein
MRIRVHNTVTCSSGNPRSRFRRKTEKSHLYVLHEKDETDPHHLMRIRIQLPKMMRIRNTATCSPGIHDPDPVEKLRNLTLMYRYILHVKDKMDPHRVDADPDPASRTDVDPCGSGFATLPPALRGIHDPDPVEKLRNLTFMYFMRKTRRI